MPTAIATKRNNPAVRAGASSERRAGDNLCGGFAMARTKNSFSATSMDLLKQTAQEWITDKAPQLGAALAYYTVFSLAPLILVLLAIVGLLFRNDPAGACNKITEQMSYFLDKSAMDVVANIAQTASQPNKGMLATIIGILLALFGASGVFGLLQNALKDRKSVM